MKRSLLPSILLVALSVTSFADRVDDLIKKEMASQNIPGVCVLITKNDRVVNRRAFGYADLELKVPMRPDMLCETGSIGKSFTATVIMQLVEAGKIGLGDPLSKYFANTPQAWSAITIRNMLTHTTGLPDYALVESLRLDGQWTDEQWMAKMMSLPLDFKTGKQFGYSNSNYLLLGKIAEKIGGQPIDKLVMDRIFKPLGMSHSLPADEKIVPNRAKGYYPGQNGLINGIKIVSGYGDGGELNTCEDLARFEKGFREGKLVKPENVALMQTSGVQANGRRTHYGFAWFDRKIFGHRDITHGGTREASATA